MKYIRLICGALHNEMPRGDNPLEDSDRTPPVRLRNGKVLVTDGPFAETNERPERGAGARSQRPQRPPLAQAGDATLGADGQTASGSVKSSRQVHELVRLHPAPRGANREARAGATASHGQQEGGVAVDPPPGSTEVTSDGRVLRGLPRSRESYAPRRRPT